jgi:predicted MFS family arabinose efflux permease
LDRHNRHPELRKACRRALQLLVGAGLLLAGLTLPNPFIGLPLAFGGAVLSIPAIRKLTPVGTLSGRPGLPAAILGMALLTFAFFGADAFIPFALTAVRGTSTLFVGAVLTVSTLAWTAGSWTLERTRSRLGPFRPMLAGLVLLVIGIAAMAGVIGSEIPPAAALVAWCVGGYGIGLAYPSFSLAVLSRAQPGAEGSTSSSLKLMEALGSAFGAGLAGAIVSAGESEGRIRLALGAMFALMGIGVVAAMAAASRIGSARGV